MFEWDRNNLRKLRAHRVSPEEAEEALLNDSIPVYGQEIGGELRFAYYGQTSAGRLLAVVATQRGEKIRVISAYDLNRRQLRDYFRWRFEGENQ
jgi:uncharacterized DUF497 family protein